MLRIPTHEEFHQHGCTLSEIVLFSANDDFANSNAIHLAKKADQCGERTIGVLTKVDIIQNGSYADKLFEFRKQLKCAEYIAVKNSPNTNMEVS